MMGRILIVYIAMTCILEPVVTSGQKQQGIAVSGMITEAATHIPLKAKVMFISFPDASEVYIDESSDSSGYFQINLHQAHKYVVEVSAPNYKPEIDTLNVGSGKGDLDFQLLSVNPGSLLRLHNIYFAQGDFHILDSSYQELSELVLLLNQYPEMVIRLEGHTDRLGGSRANMELSDKRVTEIKNYLIQQGISHKRIKTKAFGETNPIATDNTDESRRLNRRVEVRILKI